FCPLPGNIYHGILLLIRILQSSDNKIMRSSLIKRDIMVLMKAFKKISFVCNILEGFQKHSKVQLAIVLFFRISGQVSRFDQYGTCTPFLHIIAKSPWLECIIIPSDISGEFTLN